MEPIVNLIKLSENNTVSAIAFKTNLEDKK